MRKYGQDIHGSKGLYFHFDAVLALIPLVLMMVLISNLPVSGDSPSQLTISQDAQDYLNVLASSQIKDGKVMDWMVQALKPGTMMEWKRLGN